MVFAPPRSGKSELVSRRFPAWFTGRYPDRDIICASYSVDLAGEFGRDVRNIVDSQEFKRLFPLVRLAEDSQAKLRWNTNTGGGYTAAGVGTGITGRGAHCLVIDDPVKDRIEAESPTLREHVWDWYRAVAYTRLQEGSSVILTLTRWHEQDLAGKLLEQESDGGDQWTKVVLPAIDEQGNALWEERYPRKVLDQIRRTIGEYDWAALYDQRPRPRGGGFFTEPMLLVAETPAVSVPKTVTRIDDIEDLSDQELKAMGVAARPKDKFSPAPPPAFCDAVFATMDSAVKSGKHNDGVGVVYWALAFYHQLPHPLYILDYDYTQMDAAFLQRFLKNVFTRLEELAVEVRARRGSSGVLIEDKASGSELIQHCKLNGWPGKAIDSKQTAMGKAERAIAVAPDIYAGRVKITKVAFDKVVTYKGVTKNHLMSQILAFSPTVADQGEDDLLDCFTYGAAEGMKGVRR